MMMYLFLFMFISGSLSFVLSRKHLLMMLLSLEFMVISLFMSLFFYLGNMNYEYFFSMIYLTMSVCEGALGLSILIMMVRVLGNDYILSFSSLW